MKKAVLFLIGLIFSTSLVFAQINFFDTEGNNISGETITVNNYETYYFYIQNNNDSLVHLKYEATEVVLEPGNSWEVCGFGVCMNIDAPTEIGTVITLEADSIYDETHITFFGEGAKAINSITLKVYNPYNEQDSAIITFSIDYTTNVAEKENTVKVRFDNNKILLNKNVDLIEIYDLNGKLLEKNSNNNYINVEKHGIYILRITEKSHIYSLKFII